MDVAKFRPLAGASLALALCAGAAVSQEAGPWFAGRWVCTTPGPNNYCYGLAVGPDGLVYMSDYVAGTVRRFTPGGAPAGSIGSEGQGPGQFLAPHGLAFDAAGQLLVADTGNHRVQVFDAAGRWLRTIGGPGSAPGQFAGPRGIAFLPSGDAVIADEANSRVQVFSPAGQFVAAWPLPPRGIRSGPRGVTIDPSGRVHVADSVGEVVRVFGPSGSLAHTWGHAQYPPALSPFGWAIACSPGGMLYLAGRNCDIQVFALDRAVPARRSSWGAIKAMHR